MSEIEELVFMQAVEKAKHRTRVVQMAREIIAMDEEIMAQDREIERLKEYEKLYSDLCRQNERYTLKMATLMTSPKSESEN